MSLLKVQLLGSLRISWLNRKKVCRLSSRAQALFAFLVLHPQRTFRRDVLTGMFWANTTDVKARACLRSTLWRLRKVLEPLDVDRGTCLLSTRSGDVSFNRECNHDLDVSAFRYGIAPALQNPDQIMGDGLLNRVRAGIERYSGDLLEGFYDDWIISEREGLRSDHLTALTCVMNNLRARGQFEAALSCGRLILTRDPLREPIHRALMQLYVKNGQRAEALKHYSRCAELLQCELGIQPMRETRNLYESIHASAITDCALRNVHKQSNRDCAAEAEACLKKAIDDLADAIKEVRRAEAQLQQTRLSLKSD